MSWVQSLDRFFQDELWRDDLTKSSRLMALRLGTLRVIHHAYRSYTRNQASLRAAGLTLLALLALVPMLALMSAIAKGFGFQDNLWRWITDQVHDIPQVRDVVQQVLTFVDNTNFQTLGLVGLAILVYTVVMLLTHVEEAFNSIWRVEAGRSWLRRFSDYTGSCSRRRA
jgi:membrane protein